MPPEGQSVLFVERGRIDMFLPTRPERTLITSLVAGSMFGEMALVGLRSFGADLVAADDSVVVTLEQDAIENVIGRSPATAGTW